ncbi:hypothetical protein [Spongiimicrobium salis]|uniref:hypothetical protein n=1 Tax=Spongiimicrobium salis TaxID=1667022 RepID=UPI00374D7AA0
MKKAVKILSIFSLVFIFLSCEKETEEPIPLVQENPKAVSLTVRSQTGVCPDIQGDPSPIQFIGETRTYTVNTSSPKQWSVVSGNFQILGSSTQNSVTVQFNSGFTGGILRVFINNPGGQTDCTIDLDIFAQGGGPIIVDCSNPGPPTPSPIFSDFAPPVPAGYVMNNLGGNEICTTTIANILSVPFDPCDTYTWSISPSGPGIAFIAPSGNEAVVGISQPGRYRVILVTSNNSGSRTELFLLNASNCDGPGGGGGFF